MAFEGVPDKGGAHGRDLRPALSFVEDKGPVLKKGTCVDATIVGSSNRPLSKERREELEKKPSSRIDTDATSTKKRGKWYFGHKGRIGTGVGSKIIGKRRFTTAAPHDSKQTDVLLSGDEAAVFGDTMAATEESAR